MDPIYESYQNVINESKVDYEEAFDSEVSEDDFSGYALAELALDSINGLKKWIKDNKETLEDFSGSKFKKPMDKFLADFDKFAKKNKLKIKRFDYEQDLWDSFGEILGI